MSLEYICEHTASKNETVNRKAHRHDGNDKHARRSEQVPNKTIITGVTQICIKCD